MRSRPVRRARDSFPSAVHVRSRLWWVIALRLLLTNAGVLLRVA